jgi:GNAT superfamily N-acetyltransferase
MIDFHRTDSTNSDFQSLVALLDADLRIRDGEEHAFYAQYNKTQDIRNVIVVYEEGKAVACGAFKYYEDSCVEIKRMFTLPDYRGKAIGLKLLTELENWAAELNYKQCVLETGVKQPEAIRLYTKAGYTQIENYGQYAGVENSVCMKKTL